MSPHVLDCSSLLSSCSSDSETSQDDLKLSSPSKKRRHESPTFEVQYFLSKKEVDRDPRKKFLIKEGISFIRASCGDPACLRPDCSIIDACKLWIYLPLRRNAEPVLWHVPVDRRHGGRLQLGSMTHLFHVAGADRIVYLTWRVGAKGWVTFNWNEWQVLPGESVILRPKHEEIGEDRPGMKRVMQELYASMSYEGWTEDDVPVRFQGDDVL